MERNVIKYYTIAFNYPTHGDTDLLEHETEDDALKYTAMAMSSDPERVEVTVIEGRKLDLEPVDVVTEYRVKR